MLALVLPASASATETTRIIVKRDPGLTTAEQRDIRADAGVRLVDTLSLPRTDVVAAPAADASQAVRELNKDPDVVYAEIDHKVARLRGARLVPLSVGPQQHRPEHSRLRRHRDSGRHERRRT